MESKGTTPLEEKSASLRLDKDAKAKLMTAAETYVAEMKKKGKPIPNERWSKQYIKKVIGVNIGDRGGIIIRRDDTEKGFSLWEIEKSSTPQIIDDRERQPGQATLLGIGDSAKIKIIRKIVTNDKEIAEEKVLKVLFRDHRYGTYNDDFQREAKILKELGKGDAEIIDKKKMPDEKSKKDYSSKCIIMNRAPGIPLSEYLKQKEITALERNEIFIKILVEAMKIHAHGIIHCDLKPDNIIYDPKTKEVSIVDFGSARYINQRVNDGTPGYMWPQRPREAKPEIDIYSLGSIAHQIFGIPYTDHRRLMFVSEDAKKAFAAERTQLQEFIELMEGNDDKPPASMDAVFTRMQTLYTQWLKAHPQNPSAGLETKMSASKQTLKVSQERKEENLPVLLQQYLSLYKQNKKSELFGPKAKIMKQITSACDRDLKKIKSNLPKGIEQNTSNAILAYIPSKLPNIIPSVLEDFKSALDELKKTDAKTRDKVLTKCIDLFELLTRLDACGKEKNIALAVLPGDIKEVQSEKQLKAYFTNPDAIIENINKLAKTREKDFRHD